MSKSAKKQARPKLDREFWLSRRGNGGSMSKFNRSRSRWLWRSISFIQQRNEKEEIITKVDELLTQGTRNIGRNKAKREAKAGAR